MCDVPASIEMKIDEKNVLRLASDSDGQSDPLYPNKQKHIPVFRKQESFRKGRLIALASLLHTGYARAC